MTSPDALLREALDAHETSLLALGQYVAGTKPGTDEHYAEMIGALIAGVLNTGLPMTKKYLAATPPASALGEDAGASASASSLGVPPAAPPASAERDE